MKMKMKVENIRVIDLFAGCGGLARGFKDEGFTVVAGADNWAPALRVYGKNFPKHAVINVDLSNVKESVQKIQAHRPQMIVGGPPCQDFSHAGTRNEDGGRGDLTVSYARIITTIKPKYFLMENVDRILKTRKLQQAMRIFKRAGYGLSQKVLDASFCGVPQKRKRFIMFGEFGGQDDALTPYLEKNLATKPLTVREYFEEKGIEFGSDHYYRHPRHYSRRAVFSIDEPSPTVRGVNRPVPSGYNGHPGDAVRVSTKTRPLSTIERSYIQTFPKDYIFEGSKTDVEQLIGNAVPVKLAAYVARCIKEYLGSARGK